MTARIIVGDALGKHIHHIVSFAVKGLRAEVTNLALLCVACHRYVHSKRNVDREYLPPKGVTS